MFHVKDVRFFAQSIQRSYIRSKNQSLPWIANFASGMCSPDIRHDSDHAALKNEASLVANQCRLKGHQRFSRFGIFRPYRTSRRSHGNPKLFMSV